MAFRQTELSGFVKRAYDYILGEIVAGGLKAGEPISEAELTEKLNSSRTPIREALAFLEKEGMVKRYAKRGWFVAEINTTDVEEVFELRELLETWALKTSYVKIPREELLELKEQLEALGDDSAEQDFYETDRKLHSLIVEYCGNRRLGEVLMMLNLQIERVRILSSKKPKRLLLSKEEHLAITNAILAGDEKGAERMLTEHIRHVKEASLEVCRYM